LTLAAAAWGFAVMLLSAGPDPEKLAKFKAALQNKRKRAGDSAVETTVDSIQSSTQISATGLEDMDTQLPPTDSSTQSSAQSSPTGLENMDSLPRADSQQSLLTNPDVSSPVAKMPRLTPFKDDFQDSAIVTDHFQEQDSFLSSKLVAVANESQDSLVAGNPLGLAKASTAVTRAMHRKTERKEIKKRKRKAKKY